MNIRVKILQKNLKGLLKNGVKKKNIYPYATIIKIETSYHPLHAANIGLIYHMAQNVES